MVTFVLILNTFGMWNLEMYLGPYQTSVMELFAKKANGLWPIWYHLYNLKKREKHPWRSVTFSKVVTKSNTSPWAFFMFF